MPSIHTPIIFHSLHHMPLSVSRTFSVGSKSIQARTASDPDSRRQQTTLSARGSVLLHPRGATPARLPLSPCSCRDSPPSSTLHLNFLSFEPIQSRFIQTESISSAPENEEIHPMASQCSSAIPISDGRIFPDVIENHLSHNSIQPSVIPASKTEPKPSKTLPSSPLSTSRLSRPTKQVITLTSKAIEKLSDLSEGPTPKSIRIGVKNKGCAGMAYHLEYIDKPGKFDEVITARSSSNRDVKVMIDSRALFSIIGSEMDWEESKMGDKFVFNNPNIKEQCGCGESFMV